MQHSEAHTRQLDALQTFDRLREAFFRYYETPFGLADPRLQQERHDLLDRDGGVYRLPLLELRPEYATAEGPLSRSAKAIGAPDELADFAETGLIPPGRPLYLHQEQALAAGISPGRHMVITAGTGSGKTESFLLPVIASLLVESRDWAGEPAVPRSQPWWRSDDDPFAAQRDGETGRAQAVRALVLYPMKALVDDQLTRLRRAFDSDAARAWLDNHRRGHRFYFGRYTGATPVTGSSANPLAVRDLRRYLRETERRGAVARQLSRESDKEDLQYFVPRLDGAEMRSRWDMSAAPPDILITNYSMLNVMLLRERDGHFFDSTRQWLDAKPDNRFTLVVDELHTYRGTAGTEVAYLLRALKHRLGLTQRPEQLRVLAASASLDPVRDAAYLQDFFGLPTEGFTFIGGHTIPHGRSDPIGTVDTIALSIADDATAADVARQHGLGDVLRRSFDEAVDGRTVAVARSAADIAAHLFPNADRETAQTALDRILTGLASHPEPGDPRLRAHMFFRNVPGVWACSDPQCPHIPGGIYVGRTVGRLYVEPTTRCTCGARVLELLYCQTCGDVMLGGFSPEGATQRSQVDALLLADIPELAKLPDQIRLDRTAGNYLVYWPRAVRELTELDPHRWRRDNNAITYTFRRSRLDPGTGRLSNVSIDHTGWSFHVTVAHTPGGHVRRDSTSLSPYPTQCPACGDDWEITHGPSGPLSPTDPLRQRSPIRGMRTGFEKINQVLTTELATDLGEQDRKVIVFTDSRQDAAKMSSGLALRHYQDLLRLLLCAQLQRHGEPAADVALARAHIQGQRNDQTWAAVHRLQDRDRSGFDQLRDVWEGAPGTRPEDELALAARLAQAPTIAELSGVIAGELLSMGMNPGGPHAGLQQTSDRRDAAKWTTLYDWAAIPPRPRGGLSPEQQRLQSNIDESLLNELLEGLFSGAGRDFESLGLGWLALTDDNEAPDAPPNSTTGYARAGLRVLAGLRRFYGLRDGRADPPPKLRKLWSAVEDAGGPDVAALAGIVASRWTAAVRDYVIDPA
ncbi:MAG: DEAD/DEAH box helicase, partial [Pseudonocardiales bacterium]